VGNRQNLFKILGLPDHFGVILLIFTLILLIAPYFPGLDFGIFKVPKISPKIAQTLKFIAPILFLASIFMYLPIIKGQSGVTMLVTVAEEGRLCRTLNILLGRGKQEQIVKKSVLDVAINNNSRKDIMLTSVILIPQWITGGFTAGPLKVQAEYPVFLDDWLTMLVDVNYDPERYTSLLGEGKAKKEGNIFWVKPDSIHVRDIPAEKYTIKR
jgi:hypothetical protein